MTTKTPLHDAIKSRDIQKVKQLLASPTVNLEAEKQDKSGYILRPIHYAVQYSGPEAALVISWLAEAGANLNAKSREAMNPDSNNQHITALYDAAGYNHLAAAVALLDCGASPILGYRGWTPLHNAAGQDHPLMLEFLATRANINEKNPDNGMTPLHSAAHAGAVRACSRLWLLGADLAAKDSKGRTPLELAIANDQHPTAALLGRLTSTSNDETSTPFEWGNDLVKIVRTAIYTPQRIV